MRHKPLHLVWTRWLLMALAICALPALWHVGRGLTAAGGSLYSAKMTRREVRFEGPLQEVQGGQWRVGDEWVSVPAELVASSGDPELGDWIQLHALRGPRGGLRATSIRFLAKEPVAESHLAAPSLAAPNRVQLEGTLDALPAGTRLGVWELDGILLLVDAATQVEGVPALGAMAEVEGDVLGDGSVLARWIRVAQPAETAQLLKGTISDAVPWGSGSLWKIDVTDDKGMSVPAHVLVDERTFLDESRGRADVHMWAEVRAVPQADGSLWAQYVRIERP